MAKKRVTYTLDEELIERLREYSDKTMIPQAKIVNEAVSYTHLRAHETP